MAGGALRGAIPVVAGAPVSVLLAVLVPSLAVKMSANRTMMKTAPAIHPHGVGEPILLHLDPIVHARPRIEISGVCHGNLPFNCVTDNPS